MVLAQNFITQQHLKKIATRDNRCNSSHRGDTAEVSAASMQQNIFLSQKCVAQLRVPHRRLLPLLWSEFNCITLHKILRIIMYFCWRQHLLELPLLNKILMFVSNYCKHLLILNYLLLVWLLSDEALVFLKDKICSVSLYFLHPKYSVIQAKINVNHRSYITHSIARNDHIASQKGEAKGTPLA